MKPLVCIVCGMKISEKSMLLNDLTFLSSNTEENVIQCPFCGVDQGYIQEETGLVEIDPKLLDSETKRVFEKAMMLETFNGEFYVEASRLTQNRTLQRLFKELSVIEFTHARVHQRLGGFESLPKLHKPDYSNREGDCALLEEAEKREAHAIHFYKKQSELLAQPEIREVFAALAEVEVQHQTIAGYEKTKRSEP